MTEKRTFSERLANRFFAIPAVAQWWARRSAGRTHALVDTASGIPFARVRKPLPSARIALLTTAGVHLRAQLPFDMENPDGDPTYREIPGTVDVSELMITHKYYDHTERGLSAGTLSQSGAARCHWQLGTPSLWLYGSY
jgi:D-proline reductase (dithiol) PrdB